MRALCAHLARIGFASQVFDNLVGVKRKRDLVIVKFYEARDILEVYSILDCWGITAHLAVTIDTFAKAKVTRFLGWSSAQTKTDRGVRATEMGQECLIHMSLVYNAVDNRTIRRTVVGRLIIILSGKLCVEHQRAPRGARVGSQCQKSWMRPALSDVRVQKISRNSQDTLRAAGKDPFAEL